MLCNLKNKQNGDVKQVKAGFSWTTFFWGGFVTIWRKDWKWTIISILVYAILGTLGITILNPFFKFIHIKPKWIVYFYNISLAFQYNRIYINDLIYKGYVPMTDNDKQILINQKYISPKSPLAVINDNVKRDNNTSESSNNTDFVVCGKCGYKNKPNATFCIKCGNKLG